jgi:hypothetical protein
MQPAWQHVAGTTVKWGSVKRGGDMCTAGKVMELERREIAMLLFGDY